MTMEVVNASGTRVSILNDGDLAPARITLPPLRASAFAPHSRASSASTTPSLSPRQTPSLVRSSSSDSRGLSQTPSPLTPIWSSFESSRAFHAKSQDPQQQNYYFANHPPQKVGQMEDQPSVYPPLPDANSVVSNVYPSSSVPTQPQHPPIASNVISAPSHCASASPSSEASHLCTASAQANAKPPSKKNHYPCPMAKQVGCHDFFTTSGHAARHAKKHTGKKDAFCPECNKAFTRKDNMEQHRRTHQNGRGSSRTNNDDAKVKKATKPTAKRILKVEPQLEAVVEQQLAEQASSPHVPHQQSVIQQVAEQALTVPASGPYYLTSVDSGPIPALPMAVHQAGVRPPYHRSSYITSLDYAPPSAPAMEMESLHYSYPSPGLSNGLNSLALAASEHRRMLEKTQSAPSPSSDSSG